MATLDDLQQQLEALRQRVDAITAPPTDYYTQRYSGEETDRGVEIALGLDPDGTGIVAPEHGGTGADTTQAALAALGAGVRPNLLVNGYCQINQKRQTSYSDDSATPKPAFDGFKVTSGSVTIGENDLTVTGAGAGQLLQVVEENCLKTGSTYTLSFIVTSLNGEGRTTVFGGTTQALVEGLNVFTFVADSQNYMGIYPVAYLNGSVTFKKAFKLEEGPSQTLAYQDSTGAWQLLPQPDMDYRTQLLRCQQYQVYNAASAYFRAAYVSANGIGFNVPIPSTLRINPVFSGTPQVYNITLGTQTSGFTFEYYTCPGYVRVVATKTAHGLSDATLLLPAGMFSAAL